jgi:hypothetical protein
MKTIARWHTSHILGLSFFLLICLFTIDGCKSTNDWPTSVPVEPNTSAAGSWTGKAIRDLGVEGKDTSNIVASFTQKVDTLSGNWTWTNFCHIYKSYFKGTISKSGEIAMQETSGDVVQSCAGQITYDLGSYAATVSSKGDTISGHLVTTQPIITFVLVKQ